jgi:sugar lactone lactonase YvrE
VIHPAFGALLVGALALGAARADEPKPLAFGAPKALHTGKKLDTPAWLPAAKCLAFTDLDTGKLYKFDGDTVSEARAAGGRGRASPNGEWIGVLDGALSSWTPGAGAKPLAAKAANDKAWAVNDLAVAPNGRVYLTTLKDPDKGRVSVFDPKAKTVSVLFDGETEPTLANPNGVAVSPDGKALFVGVSNYKDRKHSAIYRFPLNDDGTIDVKAGKGAKWAAVTAPDGLAFGPDARLYATAGAKVVVLDATGKPAGELKIPKGSGTNLAFGGADGRTLFVTTNETLYAYPPK